MKSMPPHYSRSWLWILGVYFIVIFGVLVWSRLLLHTGLTMKSTAAFGMIALLTALIASLGGFIGARIFFLITALSSLMGSLYMMYIVIFNVSPGWGDLASIASYLVFTAIGMVLGLAVEALRWMIMINRHI